MKCDTFSKKCRPFKEKYLWSREQVFFQFSSLKKRSLNPKFSSVISTTMSREYFQQQRQQYSNNNSNRYSQPYQKVADTMSRSEIRTMDGRFIFKKEPHVTQSILDPSKFTVKAKLHVIDNQNGEYSVIEVKVNQDGTVTYTPTIKKF